MTATVLATTSTVWGAVIIGGPVLWNDINVIIISYRSRGSTTRRRSAAPARWPGDAGLWQR